jgi:ATP-dependent RNA helicase DeaD
MSQAETVSPPPPAAPPDTSQATSGSFDDLDLPEEVREGLRQMGYKAPTPVQRECFAHGVAGRDLVVQSKTGSGKTTAFALPIAVRTQKGQNKPQALVLCPTRELALQVAQETARLLAPKGLEVVAIYGGASFEKQIAALERGAAVVVGTPGRIIDQIKRGNLKMGGIRTAVLDEADEMLSMGFWEDVTWILQRMPDDRQTYLFSATLPDAIERAARQFLKDPVRVNVSADEYSVDGIEQRYYLVREDLPKPRNFLWILEVEKPRSAIVFANTKGESETLAHTLRRFGYPAEVLNGDLAQTDRERVMRKVKSGELSIMVATDIASRGIDIADLSHVFNYDLPDDAEIYVHRVGRTGRIGKKGVAVSLVRGRYEGTLKVLKTKFNMPLTPSMLPPEQEIIKMQADRISALLREDASSVEFSQYKPVAEEMLKSADAQDMLAFLIRNYFADRKTGAPTAALPEGTPYPQEPKGREPRGRDRERPRREPRPEGAPRSEGAPRPAPAARSASTVPTAAAAPAAPKDERYAPVFFGHGRKSNLEEADVKRILKDISGLSDADFGRTVVKVDFAVVDILKEKVDAVVAAAHGKVVGELTLRVEPKQRRAEDGDPRRRRGGRGPRREGAPAGEEGGGEQKA